MAHLHILAPGSHVGVGLAGLGQGQGGGGTSEGGQVVISSSGAVCVTFLLLFVPAVLQPLSVLARLLSMSLAERLLGHRPSPPASITFAAAMSCPHSPEP